MHYDTILTAVNGKVATVTLNRPQVLNALNDVLMNELGAALLAFDADDQIGCIIITGSEKAFAAGADITKMAQYEFHEAYRQDFITRNWETIRKIRKPLIAAVNGYALGGGCELAMACTIRLAADTARFGQPEINLGLIPGYAGSQRLPRLVGKGIAMEILLTGDMVSAPRAYEIGLVNRVVPAAELMTEATKLAQALAAKAPIAVRFIIEAVNQGLESPFAAGEYLETALFGTIASSEDMREGTKAFLEKRKPVWQGK